MKIYMKTRNIICVAGLLFVQAGMAQPIEKDTLALKFGNVVSGETINRSVRTNPANALFGQLTGLYMMQTAAETNVLDDQATFRIRGISTLR